MKLLSDGSDFKGRQVVSETSYESIYQPDCGTCVETGGVKLTFSSCVTYRLILSQAHCSLRSVKKKKKKSLNNPSVSPHSVAVITKN